MKILLCALVSCFALVQTVEAIPSALNQSIREYKAILDSPKLPAAVSEPESIFDFDRKTKSLDAETVFYVIQTRSPRTEVVELSSELSDGENDTFCGRSGSKDRIKKYRVKLLITPNPEIGPKIIKVVSIKPISSKFCIFFDQDEDLAE